MWSRPRARPAGWKSSTTPSRRSAAPPPWCRWRCATIDGIARLAGALNERYGKLDILVGNAALGASNSPLDHFQPKEWDEVIAVNVTANWHLIRHMHALLLRSDAGRVVFLTSSAAANPRAYRGLYATTKAALEAMARTYANETLSTPIKVNLHAPGPTRTRMRAAVAPGEDPMTLADGGSGRGDDRADVPAELSGNRKNLRLTAPASCNSFRPPAVALEDAELRPDYPRTRSDRTARSIAAVARPPIAAVRPVRRHRDRDGVRPLHDAVVVRDEFDRGPHRNAPDVARLLFR